MTRKKSKSSPVTFFAVLAVVLSACLAVLICMVVDSHSSLKSAEEHSVPPITVGEIESNKLTGILVRGARLAPVDEYPSIVKSLDDKRESSNLYWKGRALLDAKEYADAIPYFTKSLATAAKELAQSPKLNKSERKSVEVNQAWCWQNRGYCKLMLKDYEGAIPDLTLAIERSPDYRENYVNRAEAYRRLGQKENCQKDLSMVQKIEHAQAGEEPESTTTGINENGAESKAAEVGPMKGNLQED